METFDDASAIPLHETRGCLLAAIPAELDESTLAQLRETLLTRVGRSNVHGVILDLSRVRLLDARDFEALRRTLAMVELMGRSTVVVGLRAGVAAALVELDVDVRSIRAVQRLDDAHALLEPESSK